jgi:HEAT repeat protein
MGDSSLPKVNGRPTHAADWNREAEIIAELKTESLSVERERALVKQLRRLGTEASLEVLRDSLHSADINVTLDAVHALARIGNDAAVDALAECLSMDATTRLTMAAVSLRQLRSRRAVPAVIHCLETRGEELRPGQRRILVLGLGGMPHISQVPVLSAALRDPRYRMRSAAAQALARIRAPESSAALEAAANEVSWLRARPIRRGLREWRRADQG